MKRSVLWLIGAAILAASLPAGAQAPAVECPFGIMPIGQGATVGLQPQQGNHWGELAQVERVIADCYGLDPSFALASLSEEAWTGQVENLLRGAFSRAGMPVVLTHADLVRWTALRAAERQNREVRQGSVPLEGTVERPQLVVKWDFSSLSEARNAPFAFPKSLFSLCIRVKSILVVQLEFADTGILAGIFIVPLETELKGSSRNDRGYRQGYSRPYVNRAVITAVERFTALLTAEVARTAAFLAERSSRVVSVPTEGQALLSIGRRNGAVEGSKVVINGREFTLGWVSSSLSVVWAQSREVEDREALQVGAPAMFKPAAPALVADSSTPPPPPAAEKPPSSGGGKGANGAAPIHGSRTRPTGATPPPK